MSAKTDKRSASELSKRYKADPSLDNYLKLRREHPDVPIEIAVHGGIDPLFAIEDDLRKYDIDPADVAGAMDADPEYISKVALKVLEHIAETRRRESRGETNLASRGLAMPDKLIDWLISAMLDALSWNDNLYIPRDLIVLIRERNGGTGGYYQDLAKAHHAKGNAVLLAARMKARGEKPTLRSIAKILGVAPSTVQRWFAPGEFEQEVDRWVSLMDADGKLVRLWPGGPLLKNKDAQQREPDKSPGVGTSPTPEKPSDDVR